MKNAWIFNTLSILTLTLAPLTIPQAHAMGTKPPADASPSDYSYDVNGTMPNLGVALGLNNSAGVAKQLGLSKALAASANYGQGTTVGVVDSTGLYDDPVFTGRISPLSKVSAATDGHGSGIAMIIAGNTGGMAPLANILFVNNSIGTSSAIRYIADNNAVAVNLSLGGIIRFPGDINYAAGKNTVSVIAAGYKNSGIDAGNGGNGYNAAAQNNMVVVGAVDSNNVIQGWSAEPGAAMLYSNSPSVAAIPIKNVWLVAPNDQGTSWSAPYVSGAIALLDTRWPVLRRNSTTTKLLFATAQDLGDPGIDAVYGNGLLRLDKAFQPVGTLTIPTGTSTNLPVSTAATLIRSSSALGSNPALVSLLTNIPVFDSYQRDFKLNWAPLIINPSSTPTLATTLTAPAPQVGGVQFADGSQLMLGNADSKGTGIDTPMNNSQSFFASFTDAGGNTLAAGYGFPASASFASAMWGNDRNASDQTSGLGVANALTNLAEGGSFTAIGTKLGKNTRLALGYSSSRSDSAVQTSNWATPDAKGVSAGLTTQVTKNWKAGVTLGMLGEKDGLLGSTYNPNGPLSFGADNRSYSIGVSSAVALADKTSLMLEASVARSGGANPANSLISDVSPLMARSYGASLVQRDVFGNNDRMELSLKAPMKVIAGNATLHTSSVDDQGNAIASTQRFGIAPNGNELNLGLAYKAPIRDDLSLTTSLNYRHDADNISGNDEAIAIVGASYHF